MDRKAPAVEQKKLYAETVQHTNRLIISTLTVLLILFVIVHQELLNTTSRVRKLRREVIKVTERLNRHTKSLADMYTGLREALLKSPVDGIQLKEIPTCSGRSVLTADELKQIEQLQTRVTDRLRAEANPR